MNIEKLIYNSSDKISKIYCQIYTNEENKNPKGIIQVVHGMWEHSNKYKDFAKYYTDNGYIVAAHDHLGHGKSGNEHSKHGHFCDHDGDKIVVYDTYKFVKLLKKRYPTIPYFIYAHSMGGLVTINMLSRYKFDFDGLILLGSHLKNIYTVPIFNFTNQCIKIFPKKSPARTLNLALHTFFGLRFMRSKEGKNWVVRKNDYVKNADFEDPTPFFFTYGALNDVFKLTVGATPYALSKNLNINFPIYLLTGSDDPVTNYSKHTMEKYNYLISNGFKNVKISIYDRARHNLINEINRDEVLLDILNFFDKNI